jgi:hypothetical protein
MTAIESRINGELVMGCCNNDKNDSCCDTKAVSKRTIPWFAYICAGLVLLVAFNWQ